MLIPSYSFYYLDNFMTKMPKILIFLSIFLMLIVPVISTAYTLGDPLVPCKNTEDSPCDFSAILALVNNVITFLIKYMAIPITAIMFAYAGFELVTSGGSTEKRGIAKKVFTDAVIGLVLAVAAWIIIKTILSILGYKGAWIGF